MGITGQDVAQDGSYLAELLLDKGPQIKVCYGKLPFDNGILWL
jgi:GDP-D-mannose dehydratase